ncbi:MAG TPA: metallophosphoesterase family protein [Chitinophagaceae bacterium]|nr:metallophosphoesterase family protein [Chitinophagaceae bacterium]
MSRVFAIGDIHGCCKTFKKLLLEKLAIKKSDKIYCIGDYVDRGKDSKGVIDFIIQLRNKGYHIHTLRGNHEQMMLDSVKDQHRLNHWLKNGGRETLNSFGITSVIELPDKYLKFLKRTKFFIATNKYIFVHAGLDFNIENPFADKEAMLWIRDAYFDKSKINDRVLIHGHTPIPLEILRKQTNSNRINIDAGCVYLHKPGFGNLVTLSLPDMQLISINNID